MFTNKRLTRGSLQKTQDRPKGQEIPMANVTFFAMPGRRERESLGGDSVCLSPFKTFDEDNLKKVDTMRVSIQEEAYKHKRSRVSQFATDTHT